MYIGIDWYSSVFLKLRKMVTYNRKTNKLVATLLLKQSELRLEKNFQTEYFRRQNLLITKDWGSKEPCKDSRLPSWQTRKSWHRESRVRHAVRTAHQLEGEQTSYMGLWQVFMASGQRKFLWKGVVIGWGSFGSPPCLIWSWELAS